LPRPCPGAGVAQGSSRTNRSMARATASGASTGEKV
jgi:hypothetical protein